MTSPREILAEDNLDPGYLGSSQSVCRKIHCAFRKSELPSRVTLKPPHPGFPHLIFYATGDAALRGSFASGCMCSLIGEC